MVSQLLALHLSIDILLTQIDWITLSKIGSIDKSTWSDVDYEPLLDGIWREIGIHSHHQQRCGTYVQMVALIAKMLVHEAWWTQRAISVSTIIRRFNIQAVAIKQKTEKDPEKRKNIKQVSGRDWIILFSDFVRDFSKSAWRSKNIIGNKRYQNIVASIEKSNNKTSAE